MPIFYSTFYYVTNFKPGTFSNFSLQKQLLSNRLNIGLSASERWCMTSKNEMTIDTTIIFVLHISYFSIIFLIKFLDYEKRILFLCQLILIF